jgi:hypothetical protein
MRKLAILAAAVIAFARAAEAQTAPSPSAGPPPPPDGAPIDLARAEKAIARATVWASLGGRSLSRCEADSASMPVIQSGRSRLGAPRLRLSRLGQGFLLSRVFALGDEVFQSLLLANEFLESHGTLVARAGAWELDALAFQPSIHALLVRLIKIETRSGDSQPDDKSGDVL